MKNGSLDINISPRLILQSSLSGYFALFGVTCSVILRIIQITVWKGMEMISRAHLGKAGPVGGDGPGLCPVWVCITEWFGWKGS